MTTPPKRPPTNPDWQAKIPLLARLKAAQIEGYIAKLRAAGCDDADIVRHLGQADDEARRLDFDVMRRALALVRLAYQLR